jgi:cytochrome c biogenesis protein ResB
MKVLAALASLRLTPFALLLLAAASIAVYRTGHSAAAWLAAPLLLLAANLGAALATHAVFRRQLPLLVFHLALAALVLLAAAGRLTYLKGSAEVVEGAAFASLIEREAGPLHRGALARLNFVNEGFDIRYMAGPVLDRNLARLRWRDADGRERSGNIEDNAPLLLHGYRIFPTSNKGFAVMLAWRAGAAAPLAAAVHLPPYPANEGTQARQWQPAPGVAPLFIMLPIAAPLIPADRPSRFRLPERQELVLRRGAQRWTLQPGQTLKLPDGTLTYQGLRTWMGYRIMYDWTVPWILAACVVALFAMGWHFWRRLTSTPWNKD